MRNLQYVIGAAPYGVSSYLRAYGPAWIALLFQQNRAVADSELNLAQQIPAEHWRAAWSAMAGSGWKAAPTPATGGSANLAVVHAGAQPLHAVVDGALVEVRGSDGTTTVSIGLDAPPGAGTRTDLVYLEVWWEEVQPTTSPEGASPLVYNRGDVRNLTLLANDLIVLGATETARRVQQRQRLRYATGRSDLAGLSVGPGTFDTWGGGDQAGLYTRGDGSRQAAQSLIAVDGYSYAIPLVTVARSAGVTTIADTAITFVGRLLKLGSGAGAVDGYHASATPAPGRLLPLDETGGYPPAVFDVSAGSAANAETVDGYHASATPAPHMLIPLDSVGKFPNSVIQTGSGQGLGVDRLDGAHASGTPAAGVILILDVAGKVPNSVLRTGSGQGLDGDTIDGFHASGTQAANTILSLDGSGKIANAALRTGSGQGLNGDTIDGFHAGTSQAAGAIYALDASAQFPTALLRTGNGQGLDADTIDGSHAAAWALSTHKHSGRIGMRLAQSTGDGTQPTTGQNVLSNNLYVPVAAVGRYFVIMTAIVNFSTAPTAGTYMNLGGVGTNILVNARPRSGVQTLTIQHIRSYVVSGSEQYFTLTMFNYYAYMSWQVNACLVWMKD